MWHGRKTGVDKGGKPASLREIYKAGMSAGPALLMPVFIIGGIWSGYFTPTEAAAVAVVYGLFVSMFLYRDLNDLLSKNRRLETHFQWVLKTAREK